MRRLSIPLLFALLIAAAAAAGATPGSSAGDDSTDTTAGTSFDASAAPDQLAAVDSSRTAGTSGTISSSTSLLVTDGTVGVQSESVASATTNSLLSQPFTAVTVATSPGSTSTTNSPLGTTPSVIAQGPITNTTASNSGGSGSSNTTSGNSNTTSNSGSSGGGTTGTTGTTSQPPTTNNTTTTQLSTTTTAQQTTTTQSSGGRTLVFAEEFNTLNTSIWKKEYSTYGDGNNEIQCYEHDNVNVVNGKLVLTAQKEVAPCPGSTRQYSSGMVRSQGLTFSPGQSIEYRVKLTPNDDNNQGGLWPAFWSSSWAGGGWPQGGEWDGFEVMTAKSFYRSVYSIHYKKPSGGHGVTNKEIYTTDKFSDSWHTMRFDYGHNGVLTWYFDGNVVQTITDADTIQGWPTPFDGTMTQFKINLALGGRPGPIDDRALPATYEVDYVRIYDM